MMWILRILLLHTAVSWQRALPPLLGISLVLLGTVATAQTTQSVSTSNSVWLVPIDSEISPALSKFIDKRIAEANEAVPQPLALMFLIDTPGGRVDSMKEISDAILQDARVPTIALVQNAYSAGALIAMSAEELVMLPGSSIGAALTVVLDITSETGTSYAGEKANSVTRSQFRSVAEARGRDVQVAEGMVSPSIEIPGLVTSEELVTLTAQQALDNNIANLIATGERDALAQLGYGDNITLDIKAPSATEQAAFWLSSSIISIILLAVGIVGILIEVFIPGFGLPGIVGTLALMLFFGSTAIASPTGVLDIALIMGGLILLALELFVIPGFGVAGVIGLGLLGYALYRIFEGDTAQALGYTALIGSGAMILILWLFASGRIGSMFVLRETLTGGGSSAFSSAGSTRPDRDFRSLVGQSGVALTDLRPAGTARIPERQGDRIDVVTEGEFINAGTEVYVKYTEGNRVVVATRDEGEDKA